MKMQNESILKISPREALAKLHNGAVLLDVREYPEWAERHVPGAKLVPLGDLKREPQRGVIANEVLLLCKSGRRAAEAATLLAESGDVKPFIIEGGIEGWQSCGLETRKVEGGPISMERQVRIGAGALVLLGLLVPRLRFLAWFVPCGLIFAGVTDYCGMAKVLAKAPWNRPPGNKKTR